MTVSNALTYGQAPEIAGWAMPSEEFETLTLGSSGSSYQAPANGYFAIAMKSSSSAQNVSIEIDSEIGNKCIAASSGQPLRTFLPVKKGQSVMIYYSATTTDWFKFVYADGEVV